MGASRAEADGLVQVRAQLAALERAQIAALERAQIAALERAQIAALERAQIAALERAQIAALEREAGQQQLGLDFVLDRRYGDSLYARNN